MSAKFTFRRRWNGFRPMFHMICGRCIPRAWMPWLFICFSLLFLRFLWLRARNAEFQAEEMNRENTLADKTLLRHQQLEVRIRSALSNPMAPTLNFTLPVLVLACDRPAVKRTLDSLLRYRSQLVGLSPHQFPIIVSHGCIHRPTRVVLDSYKSAIAVTEFVDKSPQSKSLSRITRGYQAVARHYKHALNRMFLQLNYSAVIIVEDDLDVAGDFFQYFAATLPMLMDNQNLFCVSAWNDNGRPGLVDPSRPDLLYRTDFFAGLGWMLLRSFWLEINTNWPDIFWDEYVRKPYVRKNRTCLRPEVSRTITFGRMGISRGQFFDTYLSTMRLNEKWQNFLQLDLTYLHEPGYTKRWLDSVYNKSMEISLDHFLQGNLPNISTSSTRRLRVTYQSQADFDKIAKKLTLMRDIKSGVMRNGFVGVVPVKWKDRWIYIAPPSTWAGYDLSWT